MITVLFVTAAVLLLAITFSVIAMSERRSTASSVMTERAIQLADAGSERARRTVVHEFNNTFLSIANFLRSVADGNVEGLAGVKSVMVEDTEVHWQVVGVSDPSAAFGWIDVASTARLGGDAVQTVVRRIGFGASSTFNLAMLSETTDCMFCHLRVNGDVGNLVFMRPGWGNEGGSGRGSGGSQNGLGESIIRGNVFAAQNVTNDQTSNNRLNGARVTGVIERYSTNASLPVDLDNDGIADFPPIDREVAILNALGTVGGGVGNCVVPIGSTFSGSCSAGVSRSGAIDGNLILVGTRDNPIDLSGDIWVEGDVIIKGFVTGQGAIYSGRNVYLAGDVQTVNAPYRVVNGICENEAGQPVLTAADMTATGFSPEDACARRAIADETDALRIAARGSIVVGDYTEYDADGYLKAPVDRQSSEFYRQQFGFSRGSHRAFDPATGDELRCDGQCVNADNRVISNVRWEDAYNVTIRPGRLSASGFSSWISDAQYSAILGKEEFSYNNWRWDYDGGQFSNGQYVADMILGLMAGGLDFPEARRIVDRRINFSSLPDGQFDNLVARMSERGHPLPEGTTKQDLEQIGQGNERTQTVDANGETVYYRWNGNTLRMVHEADREFETQVNRIDAFLYANQRIAGRTSMQAMSITGGLVARDLGILAPGRGLEENNFPDAGEFLNSRRADACSNRDSPYFVYGSEDCALTVNYDHRLRNGGYGYNIIEGRIGITLDWRIADSAGERVNP